MDEIEKFQDVEHIQTEVKIAALQAMEKLKKYYSYTDALPYTVTTSIQFFDFFYFILILFINYYLFFIS